MDGASSRAAGRTLAALAICCAAVSLAGCGGGAASTTAAGATIEVVAGENFWGSIASQLGGERAAVVSIVSDPNADPHEYESSTEDARRFADSDFVILNGAGYDDWARKLLDSNPSDSRSILDVADIIGKKAGDNPHFWYSPAFVTRVADRITAQYTKLRPQLASYFAGRRTGFEQALAPYFSKVSEISTRFHGRPVGATEDIFVYLAAALNLDLVSPPAFMQAVAEGNDPPADSVAEFTDQLQNRSVVVLVYNTQTATAVTSSIRQQAVATQIPVVGISETMQPPTATFESWQVAQLTALQDALVQGRPA